MNSRNHPSMDSSLKQAVISGDIQEFRRLVNENNEIINGTIPGSNNTVLHFASRYNHVNLVTEIIMVQPALVLAVNNNLETPLYQACREGHLVVLEKLLEANPSAAYKLNFADESILVVASRYGNLDIVNYILANSDRAVRLIGLEEDGSPTTSIHAATERGHQGIVHELLQREPSLAWKMDSQGRVPLHLASSNGKLEISRELLNLNNDLSLLQDNEGRTPLHWAAVKGHVDILRLVLSKTRESVDKVTKQGETVLHLAVKFNKASALTYLMRNLNITTLVNKQDNNGNTILHLATAAQQTQMLKQCLGTHIKVNSLNNDELTPLDMVNQSVCSSVVRELTETLRKAGGMKSSELSISAKKAERRDIAQRINNSNGGGSQSHTNRPSNVANLQLHNEGVIKTILAICILIATVTFMAVSNPPGGFYQDGLQIGKPVLGRSTAYKVFILCNNVALYVAVSVVAILFTFLPFQDQLVMNLVLPAARMFSLLSLAFMAAAHLAATLATHSAYGGGMTWNSVALMSVGGGTFLLLIVGGGVIIYLKGLRRTH